MSIENKYKSIDRLFEYLENKGIPPTRLEKEVGLSNGYLATQRKRNADLGESVVLKIVNNCLDLNPMWFVFNNGEMLKTYSTAPTVNDQKTHYIKKPPDKCEMCQEKDKRIESLQSHIQTMSHYIECLEANSPYNEGQKRKAG